MANSTWEPIARTYDPLKAGSIDGTDTVPHDHGVVRAMQAVYKPNKLVVGDPKATLFVGRLNPSTDEDTLRQIFSKYGEIKRMRLIRDIVTGFSKGYAFIEFKDRHEANEAQRNLNHTDIDDKTILVDYECERTIPGWIPRRLGGGLSGKKESGQLRFGGRERPFKRPLMLLPNSGARKYEKDRNANQDRHFYKDRRNDSERNYSGKKYDSYKNDRAYSKSRHSSRNDSERYEGDGRDYRHFSKHDYDRDTYSSRHDYKKSKHH